MLHCRCSNYLSPHISPCLSPAIREFRQKTSPSLLNLKSPAASPRNSRILSPASSISPQYATSSTNLSPHSATSSTNLSPDYRNKAGLSPGTSSNGSIFSFNFQVNLNKDADVQFIFRHIKCMFTVFGMM